MLRHIAGGAKGLDDFDVIVLDEVHERHTSTDVLLGTMRGLLARRPALRLVLMSATLNLELFSSFFGGAPVLRVPGRAYPVDVVHVTADADVAAADASADAATHISGNARPPHDGPRRRRRRPCPRRCRRRRRRRRCRCAASAFGRGRGLERRQGSLLRLAVLQ